MFTLRKFPVLIAMHAAAILALSMAAPAQAQVDVALVIGNAPPPPRFESVPQPRRGQLWVPGYWDWNGYQHVWTSGHWERERVGYQYRPGTWVRESDGWRLQPGAWVALSNGNVRVEYATTAPPPPRYEVVPAPRPGFVWSSGYWELCGNRHEWVDGHWEVQRPGYVYTAPRWVEHDGRWVRDEGRWDRYERHARYERRRNRDNDGVPNRYDRDRDGDGVPNRYDEHPDNPRRH